MTRHAFKSRYRNFAVLAVAAAAAAGLSAPVFFNASLGELSINTAAVIAATRDSYTLTSPVPLPLLPNVMIEAGRLSVDRSAAAQPLSGAEVLALLTTGKAKILLDDAVLSIAPTQSAETTAPDAVNALAPVLSALMKLSFSNLEMRNALVQLGRGDGAHGTLSKLTLEVTKVDSSKARATGSFNYRKRAVAFDIVLGTQAELQDGSQKGQSTIGRSIELTIESELLNLKAAGTLSAGDQPLLTSASSTVGVPNLRRLARWIGIDLGQGSGLGAFEARGPLEFSSRAIAFSDATFVLDGNEANGALSFKWGGVKRPSIDGTLAFKSFDVAPYVTGRSDAAGTRFNVSDYLRLQGLEPHTFPLIDQIDADLRLSAASVLSGATTFGRGAASFSLKDGILLADLAELEIGKSGRCGGQFGFEVRDNTPIYSLRGKLEAIDLAALTQALWSYNVLSGSGDVTLDLKAAGQHVDEVLASMSGKVAIRQSGVGQIGVDLKTLAATTRAQAQNGWGGATRGQTAIEGLSADLSMAEGRLIADRVSARAGDAALSAVGSVNFADKVGDVKVWITHPAPGAPKADVGAGGASADAKSGDASAAAAAVAPTTGGTAQPAAEARGPGGGLHVHGRLDAPEIRFIPLDPASSTDAREPLTRPAAPAVPAGSG